jgi:hypothetical protein
MAFLQLQFDKVVLFLLFLIAIGAYVRDPQEFTQGLVSTVIGALILALTGRAASRAADNGGKPPEGK